MKIKNNLETPNPQRAANLYRSYKLTVEDYDNILKAQNGVCAICKLRTFNERKRHRGYDGRTKLIYPLCVDHDHNTGKVRGLLCNNCNTGIGYLKDDLQLVQNALDYLKKAV